MTKLGQKVKLSIILMSLLFKINSMLGNFRQTATPRKKYKSETRNLCLDVKIYQ